jgi:hypothetical protein
MCAGVQMSVNSVMHGSKLFTLRPNLHEQLDELMVMELTLPEDIERMKTAKRRDKEQVSVRACGCVAWCTWHDGCKESRGCEQLRSVLAAMTCNAMRIMHAQLQGSALHVCLAAACAAVVCCR